MKKLITILLIANISCHECYEDTNVIDTEFLEYYETFIEEGKIRGYDYSRCKIVIEFGKTDAQATTIYRIGANKIVINRDVWNKKSPSNIYWNTWHKEITIMHELGHAILNKDHDDNCLSLMHIYDNCKYAYYQHNRDLMLDDLFE